MSRLFIRMLQWQGRVSLYCVCVNVSKGKKKCRMLPCSSSSASTEDDVDSRVRKNRPTHVSHFKSEGGVFERLLHLTWNMNKQAFYETPRGDNTFTNLPAFRFNGLCKAGDDLKRNDFLSLIQISQRHWGNNKNLHERKRSQWQPTYSKLTHKKWLIQNNICLWAILRVHFLLLPRWRNSSKKDRKKLNLNWQLQFTTKCGFDMFPWTRCN